MDSEKHTEILNYFLNKDKKYPERNSIMYHPRNVTIRRRILGDSMDRDGVWATDAEIISTANLLGCDINVYCKMDDKLNWQRFPTQFTLSQSADACLYLDNSSGDHYDVILSDQ